MFRKTLLSLALAASFVPTVAQAQSALATEGPWLVRVRASYLQNDNANSPVIGLGQVEVQNRWIPEFDISYFFTDNIAAELVLTWPQKMDVTLGGADIGSVKALPPTLMLQYHFMPDAAFRPYAGVGVNYTRFSSQNFSIAGLDTSNSSFGAALQGGIDIQLAPRWYLNADVKYIWMNTDVTLNGAQLTKVDINPWMFSIGLGYRF